MAFTSFLSVTVLTYRPRSAFGRSPEPLCYYYITLVKSDFGDFESQAGHFGRRRQGREGSVMANSLSRSTPSSSIEAVA